MRMATSRAGILLANMRPGQLKRLLLANDQNIFFGNNTMRTDLSLGANMNNFHLAQWSNYESWPLYNIFVSVTRKARIFLDKHK